MYILPGKRRLEKCSFSLDSRLAIDDPALEYVSSPYEINANFQQQKKHQTKQTNSGMKDPPSLLDVTDLLGALIVARPFFGAIVPGGGDSNDVSSTSCVFPSSDIEPESS
jgi:hypothetical protein